MSGRYIEQFDECVDMRLSSFSVRNDDRRRAFKRMYMYDVRVIIMLSAENRISKRDS